jgi:hypothetical protein
MSWFWLALLVGCSGDDSSDDSSQDVGDDDDDDDVVGDDDDDTTTTPTATTGDTAPVDTSPTGDTGGLVVDCAAIPAIPTGASIIPGLRSHHGLAFDDLGYFYGHDNGNVIKWDYYGAFALIAPGIGSMEQFDYDLATGMLYVASGTTIKEISPTGVVRNLGSISPGAYGVKVGPDGLIYAANNNRVYRIDPVAQTQEIYIDSSAQWDPRVMDWSPDNSKFYFASLFAGKVFSVDIDSNFDPVAPPVVLANGFGSYNDGMLVDVCGNIYLSVYGTSATYRIDPSGVVTTLMDPTLTNYGHGMQFGSGVGGWLDDAIYLPQPYNGDTVTEVIVGVPHRTWQGTVINLP